MIRNYPAICRGIFFLFVFLLLVPSGTICYSQENFGRPKITNYTYQEFNGEPLSWWITEGDNGLMYFANQSSILEFDGVNWKKLGKDNSVNVRTVEYEDGNIYWGGTGDFGMLVPDENGEYKNYSLINKVPKEYREFRDVWEVYHLNNKFYFTTDHNLFIWDGSNIEVVTSEEEMHVTAIVDGEFYCRIWGRGLCVLKDGKFELVPGGDRFANTRIYQILPYDDQTLLLGVLGEGFYLYDGETFEPFKTEIDEVVKNSLYLPGARVPGGKFVINTQVNGAYLIDKKGKLIQAYTRENGIVNGAVRYVYVDSRNLLWMATNSGIASVDLSSPYTYFESAGGFNTEGVLSMAKKDGLLYLGTDTGILYSDLQDDDFYPLDGTSGQTFKFLQVKDRLYSASNDMGLIEVKGKSFEYVRKNINYNFRLFDIFQDERDSNRIFAITMSNELYSFYFDEERDKLIEESSVTLSSISEIEFSSNGNIWLDNLETGVVEKIVPHYKNGRLELSDSEIKTYTTSHGLPDEQIWLFNDGKTVYFLTEDNAFIYNPEKDRFTETSTVWTAWIKPGRLIDYSFSIGNEELKIANLGKGIIVKKEEAGKPVINPDVFKELNSTLFTSGVIEEKKPDGSRVVWFGGYDGLVRYEGKMKKPEIPQFNTKIRAIKIGGDSLVYGGAGSLPEKLKLEPSNSTITFNYAAPVFDGQNNIEYSTLLEGLDDKKWSGWSKQTSREYVNLSPGDYTFKVKSRSITGQESGVSQASFFVRTPWYLSWWAYLVYALLAGSLIYLVVRRRTSMLRERQKILEENVEERTKEVQKRMKELATVNHVSQALTEKLKLNELIQRVGDEMKKLFNSDITYLALVDKENNIIKFPYQDGDTISPQKFGQGLTSKIITTGEPLLINKDKDIEFEYSKMGIKQSGKPAISYLGVPIPSEDEIIGVLSVQSTELESRFNEEDKRLLNTIAINVGIALHNAELYEQARLAKLKAEEANEAKSAFLSTVSHELRTPLTSVLGFAKIIRKRLEDKIFPAVNIEDQKIKRTMKQVSENLNVVVSEGERLTTLINDVLDLAKIESGKMEWNMKPIFLQEAISRAVASTKSLFDQKGLKLKKKVPSNLPLVNADEDKLIQVVINLISNAVKFTDSGKVEILAYQDKDQIIVEVQDTGIGIAEEDHYRVFEKFRQAGDTLTDKPKGTGLGLPICREIIEHHGGIIWMTSEPGVGSTFYFSIPVLSKDAENQPVQLERIITSLKKQIKHSQNGKSKKAPTILVVDDATPIRSLLRQELTEAGYQVQEAADGKLALDMVRNSKPDLIILDVMMPEINGFDVAAVLKNDPATMDIPIIILSIVQDKERGLKIGVDRYLTKPINTEELFHEVDVLLEQGVSKKKVLVVDEDTSAVNSLSEVLTARGYKVMNSNGENLYESATETRPDIIMLNSVYNGNQKIIKDIKLQKGMENVMFFIYE